MAKALTMLGMLMFIFGLLLTGPIALLVFFAYVFKIFNTVSLGFALSIAVISEVIGFVLIGVGEKMKKYGVVDEELFEDLIAQYMQEGKTFEEAKKLAEQVLAKMKQEGTGEAVEDGESGS